MTEIAGLFLFFEETDHQIHQIIPVDEFNIEIDDVSVPSERFYATASSRGIPVWIAQPSRGDLLDQITFLQRSSSSLFPSSLPDNMPLNPPVDKIEDALEQMGTIVESFEAGLLAISPYLPHSAILILAQPH